jgi:WhiB family redox-sensing transcriptional regulator
MTVVLAREVRARRGYSGHDLSDVITDVYEMPAPLVQPVEQEREPDWQEFALCAETDPEAFFPEKGGSTKNAKKVCAACPVRRECLEYALDHDERFGIWGGLSERERRRLRRSVNPLHALPEVDMAADDSPLTQDEVDADFAKDAA